MTAPPVPDVTVHEVTVLDVVAAVLHDGAGRVLVAQRPPGKVHAGEWEFPGGKQHRGEAQADCLVRELREELGIEVASADCVPLMELEHRYPDRHVRLHVWSVMQWRGEPASCEGQALRWLVPRDLHTVPLLSADGPIVKCLLARANGPVE
jgi:8-oxo-dGTP diphosphatase